MWVMAFSNDLGRLAKGVVTHTPKGSNNIYFITRGKVPNGKKIPYGRIVAEIRPYKSETHRVCLTLRGYRLQFDGVAATNYVVLVTTKILFNGTLSTLGAQFCTFETKDFYYGSLMEYYE